MHYDEALDQAGSATAEVLGALATVKVLLQGFIRPCAARWPDVRAVINHLEYDEATGQFSLPQEARDLLDRFEEEFDQAEDNAWPEDLNPLDGLAMDAFMAVHRLIHNTGYSWGNLGLLLSTDCDDYLHFIRLFASARCRFTGETLHFSEIGGVGNVFVFEDFLPPTLVATTGPKDVARMLIDTAWVAPNTVDVKHEPGVISLTGDVDTMRHIYEVAMRNEDTEATIRAQSPSLPADKRVRYEPVVDFTTECPVPFPDILAAMGNPEPQPMIDDMNWGAFLGNAYRGTITLNGEKFHAAATEKDGVITELEISPQDNASFLGIPFHIPTPTFTERLDERGIPWADDGRLGIVLYEHWVTLYNHDRRIEAILWHNPDTLTDIELLDLAFPPDNHRG